MASILKRKGGPLEVVDSPKRVKSVKELKKPTPKFAADATGWDAAFKAPKRPQELVATNGSKEDDSGAAEEENAPQAEDFENFFVDESQRAKEVLEEESRRAKKAERPLWKSTEPIGGRMINVDPVFSMDEKFLIVATRVSVHVYSTVDSLLARSIRLQIDFNASPGARIITYCLSPTSPNLVWVACSHGAIYSIDWTTGAGADQYWGISSTGCIHMTVASMESAGRRRDVVFTTELRKDNNGWRITANELASPNGPIATVARTIYTSTEPISFLKTANEGSVIVAASERRVLIGSLRSTEYDTIDKIRYEFRIFLSTDLVSALDVRVSDRKSSGEQKSKKNVKKVPIVDVVVGDVKGSIFVHNDLLANLIQSQTGGAPGINLLPRKLHWHRQAVYSVKWSQDGNYIISGGTETVLLLWQLDTGLQQMLPHMSATIQNVVISPSGSSYGIQLADNSAMVLSTAELKPTANIAGIQAPVVTFETSIISRVDRVKDESWESPLVQRTPAVINPQMPSRLLLGVGQVQEISHRDPTVMSAPYLQTFDLSSGHNISRQAVTRTNVTNVNIAPSAHRISEPRITHMQISTDGNWLATVDEWLPPKRDLQHLGHQGIDLETERLNRREVFLKFWQWNDGNGEWELVSRIDAPHTSGREIGAGRILDLASDPSNLRFSTIGEDNIVRTWSTRTRKRDGVVVRSSGGTALKSWTCEHAVHLGKPALEEELIEGSVPSSPQTGCVAFSDDGSTLAAASGDDGVVHLLDPESGIVRLSRSDMFSAEIIKLEILGQDLVTLSDFLLVYDLVADEIRYSVSIGDVVTSLSIEQKLEMMHLAIDRQHQTFAVALPSKTEMRSLGERYVHKPLLPQYSELAVFSPNFREALMKATFSTLVTALVPAIGSEGYISLDTSAEITTTLPEGKSAITALAMATSELQPAEKEESTGHLLQLVEDSESMDEDVEAVTPTGQDEYEDDDDEIRVTQQQLSAIFDVGPAFALPPIEEMFYQVAGLFTHRPKS